MASVWAIGDIHGMYQKMEALLEALPRQADDYTVFLGDYIDRGPDSAGVIRRVLAEYDAAPERTILMWGNHEDMAASHFHFPAPSGFEYDPYDWFRNGGHEALESYGLTRPGLYVAACPDDMARLFPLLKTFWRAPAEVFPTLTNCIWVHAGVLPWQEPEESLESTLLWVREDFLNKADEKGRVIIHGHTPFRQVRALPDKIGIDTGAFSGGPLTALQLPERRIYQADGEGNITISDLPKD
jgi:serine/threonine protein phosphatase 1